MPTLEPFVRDPTRELITSTQVPAPPSLVWKVLLILERGKWAPNVQQTRAAFQVGSEFTTRLPNGELTYRVGSHHSALLT